MLKRFQHLRRDQRGVSLVFVGFGFIAFFSATTLAIDVGMLMTARTQAQTAADAGALAGATAIAFNSATDQSDTGPAKQSALHTAQAAANNVMSAAVSILPADITFENDANGQPTRVHVNVYRTTARGNPVPTLIGSLF